MSLGNDLTFLVAVLAGLISFLSPCVLPLVPAYLGQLTAVAVAASPVGTQPSRWLAVRHAAAYVLGFGLVFTVLGVTATYAGGALGQWLPLLRQVGGAILIVMGLNLAGILTIGRLQRTWRPLDLGASTAVAGATGGTVLRDPTRTQPGLADRLGGRMVGSGRGLVASFGLGTIFAIGWTPCIGTILGGILTMAATSGSTVQGGLLLTGYTLGLGVPFLAIGALYDRAPALLRPLQRHARAMGIVGGLLVAAIGLAMVFDLLSLMPRYFQFLTAV
ncbi:MAG: cytochrome c biogenesis CcdA family protein [Candidatus Limnocylindrales bacterium]